MISWYPVLKRIGSIGIPVLFFFFISAGWLFSAENSSGNPIMSVGLGPPPPTAAPSDQSPPPFSAVDDAEKKAVLSYLYGVLGPDEFSRLQNAVDTLITPEYKKYITDTRIVSVSALPGGDVVVIKAAVSVDENMLLGYLENIRKLDARPEGPRVLTAAEKENLISRAQAIYIQGEVASDILLDRLRGIESFDSARTIFEEAESAEGVYRCLMGIGRAHEALGDLNAAREDYKRALELSIELKRPDFSAQSRLSRARLFLLSGDVAAAETDAGDGLMDASTAGETTLIGEALLLSAEIDRASGMYDTALIEARGAVEIFERLADVNRLIRAQLMLGLVHLAVGNVENAVEAFKKVVILAEKIDDPISKDKALIGLAAAYRNGGSPKTALLYLADALRIARERGWRFGEVSALCETALAQIDTGNAAAAESTASGARTIAFEEGSPILEAAALFVLGEARLSLGKKDEAFEALGSSVEISSDIRVAGHGVPFLFFNEAERNAALSSLLSLSVDLGLEKKIGPVLAARDGAVIAHEIVYDPPALPARETEALRLLREAELRAIVTDATLLSGDFIASAETSRAEARRLRNTALSDLSDSIVRISRNLPSLARFMGMVGADPADLSRSLPVETAFIHWVTAGEDSYALVVTRSGLSFTRLPGDSDEILEAVRGLGKILSVADRHALTAGNGITGVSPDFSRLSADLYSLLIAPILPELSGVTVLGIAPGAALSDLPIKSLGRIDGDGRFVFLAEDYDLIDVSLLSGRVVSMPLSPAGTVFKPIVIVGDESPLCERPAEAVIEGEVTEDAGEGGASSDTVAPPLFVCTPVDSLWWESTASLIAVSERDMWGSSDFVRREYAAYLADAPLLMIPEEISGSDAAAFLAALAEAAESSTIRRGYWDTVRTRAFEAGSGGSLGWVRYLFLCDFESER